jgi:proteic killer suppression protein
MILSFRDKRTAGFAEGQRIREFQGFSRQAHKRLEILNAATSLNDLRNLPSNHFKAVETKWSIRINKQWRIYFEWPETDTGPSNVEIFDPH